LLMKELDKNLVQVTDTQELAVIRNVAIGLGISEASVKVINEPRLVRSALHWALGMVIRGPTGEVFYMQKALLDNLVQNHSLVNSLINHENKERELIKQGFSSEEAHSRVINEDAEQEVLMQVAGNIVYQVKKDEVLKVVANAEGLFASGNFKAGISEARNALAGAKLVSEKLYSETADSIMKMLINVRDASGIRGSPAYENNLFTPSLSSALNIMLFLMKQKSESQPKKAQQPGIIINEALQEAFVRNIVDQQFRDFAVSQVINSPINEREKLLINMGFGWLSRFAFSHFRNEESQKNMVLFALDGRTVNSIHCSVVAAERLLNNPDIRKDLASKGRPITEVITVERLARDFGNKVLEIIQTQDPKEIREFLSELSLGYLSYDFTNSVLSEKYGVTMSGYEIPLEELLNPSTGIHLPFIFQVPANGIDGRPMPHFMLFGGVIASINGAQVQGGMVRIEDRHGNIAVPFASFAGKFAKTGYLNILSVQPVEELNLRNGRKLAQLELSHIFGGDGQVTAWLQNKDAINLAGVSEKGITYRRPDFASLRSALPPQVAAQGAFAAGEFLPSKRALYVSALAISAYLFSPGVALILFIISKIYSRYFNRAVSSEAKEALVPAIIRFGEGILKTFGIDIRQLIYGIRVANKAQRDLAHSFYRKIQDDKKERANTVLTNIFDSFDERTL
ncbi:MAG: hypothetical protein AAB267_09470, partial [Candidatus Desantisbacteria bacterium]